MTKRVIGVIPARLESTRLSRKLLRPILGHPMLTWVYRRAWQARCLDDLLVATDSEEILAHCRQNGIPATMTSVEHGSGTDRIFEVMTQRAARLDNSSECRFSERGRDPGAAPLDGGETRGEDAVYVNIQGDEPMIAPEHLDLLLQPFRPLRPFREDAGARVSTLKVAISLAEARDPNNVKVVAAADGRALYFSRALVPYDRDRGPGAAAESTYYKHLGLYAYTPEALRRFHELPPSPLERREKLEQLRFLENGIPIIVLETTADTIGVDTEEDLARVEKYFCRTGTMLPESRGPVASG
ncbi:MAG TPA: 3-deoxy-manno-octulosonate cytidylyltransferase [Terriglobia bacterium]|nr:3-deoxy-manno-octulosonate cytidylyltransferase [Terriglobia bacterium]